MLGNSKTTAGFVQAFLRPTAGTTTVTATYSGGSPTAGDLYIYEVSGLTNAQFDQLAFNANFSGSTTANSSFTSTLSSPAEFAIGFGITETNYTAYGSGWTGDIVQTTTGSVVEHQILSSTAAIEATATNSSGAWVMWAVTLMSGPWFSGTIIGRQEQPASLLPLIKASVPSRNVAPPVSGTIIGRQESPGQPPPQFFSGVQGPSHNVAPPVSRTIIGRQEQPAALLPLFWIGVQGPNVAPPVRNFVLQRQELPDHFGSRFWIGVQGPNVAIPVRNFIITTQELPRQPPPQFFNGVQGPNVAIPVRNFILQRQEVPDHFGSRFSTGIQGPNVAPPVSRIIIGRQELPASLLPLLLIGIQGPSSTVAPPIRNFILQWDALEWPWHPLPIFVSGFGIYTPPPPPSPSVTDWLLRARRRHRR